MRFTSTPESVSDAKPSILAILETVVAVLLSLWIAVRFGTVTHIAISACVAPLLLLRTDYSIKKSLVMLDRWDELTSERPNYGQFLNLWDLFISYYAMFFFVAVFMICVPILAIFMDTFPANVLLGYALPILVLLFCPLFVFVFPSLLIRIIATISSVCRYPCSSLAAIPTNSFQVAFCVDCRQLPELVPEYEAKGKADVFKMANFLAGHSDSSMIEQLIAGSTIVLMFLTSFIYRWSLKSTSPVFLPLIYIAWTATRRFRNLSEELKRLYKGEIAELVYYWSFIVIALFALKFAAIVLMLELSDWWQSTDLQESLSIWSKSTAIGQLANRIIAPDQIPVWQIASFTNAVMAIALAAFAKRYFEYEWNISDTALYRLLRTSATMRAVLSCYSSGVLLWIVATTGRPLHLPQIGPWLP